jgi:hypothetical protein
MERRIVLKNAGFVLIEELGAEIRMKAMVPGRMYRFDDVPAILRIRLDSTRAGNAARWSGKELPQGALNNAPYNPILRGFVDHFIWFPPASRDNLPWVWGEHTHGILSDIMEKSGWVVQEGSAVINWAARVVAPVPDPIRDMLVVLLEKDVCWNDPLVQRQGRLEVRRVYGASEISRIIPGAGSGYRRLFNHYIYPLDRWVWRVIDETAYALFVPSNGEAYVVSPDHETEWLRLVGDLFIARHPLPRGGDKVVD